MQAALANETHNQLVPDMVCVPAGEFTMGCDQGDADERPARRVWVDEFYVGAKLVTNAEYAAFLTATGRRAPGVHEIPLIVSAGGADRERLFRDAAAPYSWKDGHAPSDRADHPVTLISCDDAAAYCEWLAGQTGKPF